MSRATTPMDPLDRPIKDLFLAPQIHHSKIRALLCTNPVLIGLLRQTQEYGTGQEPILSSTRDKVMTTLFLANMPPGTNEPALHGPKFDALLATSIRAFNKLRRLGQVNLLDAIQLRIVDSFLADKLGQNMSEPAGDAKGKADPLPSSLKPANPAIAAFRLVQREAGAWATHSIGFRVEGSKGANGDDLARILKEGCQPLTHKPDLLLKLRGWVVTGTHIGQRDRAFIRYLNCDILNETATCVSRSRMGATAIPTRDTDTVAEGMEFHYLLATDCRGLRGVDTEFWQANYKPPTANAFNFTPPSNWRPGEKAFMGIGASRVLGWTRLIKRPGGDDGGWWFMLPDGAWTWINKPDTIRTAFLEAELTAWTPGKWNRVNADYDFA